MKIVGYMLLVAAGFITSPVSARQVSDTITVTGTRFTFPLVQEWIDQFRQTHPQTIFRLVSPRDPAASQAVIHFVAQRISQKKETFQYTPVARYALLPVTNTKSGYAAKPLTVDALRALYFKRNGGETTSEKAVVYNRREKSCAPVTFASFYGAAFEDIKGKQVPGDDQQLLKAVQEDPDAISFNNPGFIYDLRNRKPVHDIAVIPLDLNGNGQLENTEDFYADLDVLIRRLETAPPAGIPIEDVVLSYDRSLDKNKPIIREWIQYIQAAGQEQLHHFGFLTTSPATAAVNR
ncbi:hypothetical protein [Chitinophaga qingshengii]|uniref:Phosphate/phosphite/phosphonate ABC transporter substrate-binding protein n=1 Tax=Chitinophaga qingshengii TaxID=1569794 RepID=A0ABR7TWG2_9BACT|nr:hypothetical protein [Chitinophaga qingshengii]MBC9934819.1 hypothetical protein [Chitinophaga qingshengii]